MLSKVKERLEGQKYDFDFGVKGWGRQGKGIGMSTMQKGATLWKCLNTFVPHWKEEAWKKNQGFNGIRTRDLRVTGALLYQLSYEATHWERGQFIEALIFFFQASSFQLLKLENLLRWSFFTFIYNRGSENELFHVYFTSFVPHCSLDYCILFNCSKCIKPVIFSTATKLVF